MGQDNAGLALFQPTKVNGLELNNRLVMAPMTRSKSPGGVPGADVAAYYRRRTEGGVGLIITEGTTVDHPVASNDVNVPVFHGAAALAGWKHVVDEVHAAGGKIMPQLWHMGMARRPGTGQNPELPSAGPSGYTTAGKFVGEPMSEADIEDVIQAFATAAKVAQEIGFDGVELHGAHSYLIDEFFWELTNRREDDFGGGLVERTTFACEIVKAVRAAVGPDYPIILRISQWKQADYDFKLAKTPEELEKFLAPLVTAGVDIFHCSQRRFWEPEFKGSDLNLAGWARKLTGKPSITVGSVGLDGEFTAGLRGESAASTGSKDIMELERRLDAQEFDLVAVGRALLVDGAWPEKMKQGRYDELLPYSVEALATLS